MPSAVGTFLMNFNWIFGALLITLFYYRKAIVVITFYELPQSLKTIFYLIHPVIYYVRKAYYWDEKRKQE